MNIFLITKLNKKEKSAQIFSENIRAGKLQFSILDKESTIPNQHPPLSPPPGIQNAYFEIF